MSKVDEKKQEKQSKPKSIVEEFDDAAMSFAKFRKNPLLILYYPDVHGQMSQRDVKDVYDEFRRRDRTKAKRYSNLDVMIHTYGGVPQVGYLLAQVIRDFSDKITFLVPEYSFSAGTVLCLSGNDVRLADHALLSPIDITIHEIKKSGTSVTELISVDYFMQFAEDCRKAIEKMLDDHDLKATTKVESDLLVEFVKQVGALQVGEYYRLRKFSEKYALKLLKDYMFADRLDGEHLAGQVVQKLLFEYPSHSFVMDYHICRDLGIPVSEMSQDESDKSKEIISNLSDLAKSGHICKNVDKDTKIPFFRLYEAA
ncbi:MAG: hypothetical protein WA799_03445 [Nitrosotalea sp.]